MSFGPWIDIIDTNEVNKITQMVLADSSTSTLKEYLTHRYYLVMRNKGVTFESFDEESTKILIELIRDNQNNHNLVYSVLKMYVYHTYMVVFHKMQNDEYRLLRYKLRKVSDPKAIY